MGLRVDEKQGQPMTRTGHCTSIMMTAREIVSLVTPPMKAPAPMSANAPGSTQAQGLGVRNTPGGALH